MALDEENVLSFINTETSLPSFFFNIFLFEDSEARNDKVNFQKIYQEIPQFY